MPSRKTKQNRRKTGKDLATRFKDGHKRLAGVEGYLEPAEPRTKPPVLRYYNEENTNDKDEYFITHIGSQEMMWNESFSAHLKKNPHCTGKLCLNKKWQAVISTQWSLKCDQCPYESDRYCMYKPVMSNKRGRKKSTLNLALGAALLQTPIGPWVCEEILLTLGIDPGSRIGIQRVMTESGKITVRLGKENMKEEQIKSELLRDGKKDTLSADTRYDNNQYSSPTPGTFQAGRQSVTTVVSHTTNKVIDTVFGNKHCPVAWALKRNNINVTCPEHEGCLANLKFEDPIGNEGRYTRESARRLKDSNYKVGKIVTDKDSKGANAFADEYGEFIELLSDPVHLSRGHRRSTKQVPFSDTMFPGTKRQKQFAKGRFAEDLKLRCTAEFNVAVILSKDPALKLETDEERKIVLTDSLSTTPEAILNCYKGDHSSCQANSFVCKPEDGRLWQKPCVITQMKEKITMTSTDEVRVLKAISLRLGASACSKTYENITTNKCEAMNRAYSKTNPKNTLSTTNFEPRILSAVLTTNLGFDDFCELIHSNLKHEVSDAIKSKIKAHAQDIQKRRESHQSQSAKSKRLERKFEIYNLHNRSKQNVMIAVDAEEYYKSGMTLFDDEESSDSSDGDTLQDDSGPGHMRSSEEPTAGPSWRS